jgi:hypothetical protein
VALLNEKASGSWKLFESDRTAWTTKKKKKGHKTLDLTNLFIRENKYWFLMHTSIASNLGIFEAPLANQELKCDTILVPGG